MKTILLLLCAAICIGCKAQIYVDSVKIVQLNDTSYGLALYDVVMPSGPCTIKDSLIQITPDTIKATLCYLYGNSASQLCHGYDTVFLGNIDMPSYTVVLALAAVDWSEPTNTCINPNKKDTIVFYYTPTNVEDIKNSGSIILFSNLVKNVLTGKLNDFTSDFSLHFFDIYGKQVLSEEKLTQPNFTIDVSALPPGLYFLQLTNGRQRAVRKFVKQ
jgi:hypothetical protein